MRSLSLTLRQALNAPETDQLEVFLLTVSHPSLAVPLRFSSDPTTRLSVDPTLTYGTTSRGQDYGFLPMSLTLPDDSEDAPPALKIVLDGVTRETIPLLRSISTPATVLLEMVLASDPDTVEVDFGEYDLVAATYDALHVTLDLAVSALASEPFPAGTFTPSQFPGLF